MTNKKLKVGVITMHRVVNYGSVLQAYATQQILERIGCNCEIIDYVFPNSYHFLQGYACHSMTWKNRIAKVLWLKKHWRLTNKFERFWHQYLHLSCRYPSRDSIMQNPPCYDVYLTGSDQVWNPRHMKGDDVFLLSFVPNGMRLVSYASSFACSSLTDDVARAYAPLLKRYEALSVREENGRALVRQLTERDAFVGLDPTLLLDASEWRMLAGGQRNPYQGRKYILLYMMSYAFNPAPYIYQLLEHLQRITGMEVITFTPIPAEMNLRHVTVMDESSPITFLQLFDVASCVVTSSFHGTAFAVNFGKPLYSLVDSNYSEGDDRQSSLLKELRLDDCIIKMNTELEKIPGVREISTTSALSSLEDARNRSVEYLRKTFVL